MSGSHSSEYEDDSLLRYRDETTQLNIPEDCCTNHNSKKKKKKKSLTVSFSVNICAGFATFLLPYAQLTFIISVSLLTHNPAGHALH
jgi:hypothetical protein